MVSMPSDCARWCRPTRSRSNDALPTARAPAGSPGGDSMRLLRLRVVGFGVLQGEYRFAPDRLTLIVDDNERGKSTLLAAIAAALYGLDGDRRTHRMMTPLDRWRPWEGGPYRL